ncbi:MAG TPA: GAF domain-containing protein [Verrucomicrobiae bacterium]|jgi:putative methionine-R-sulfoxide reductase with GAF domain|nr:GAF domain-containing protein [Verrucomicrobiae bacterium]
MNDLPGQISALLEKISTDDSVLSKALAAILADFQSETGTIHLLDAGTQLLRLTAQVGLPPQMLEVVKTIPVGKGIAGQTVAQNKPVTICNLQTDTSGVAKPGARQSGVGGALCVPMRRDGKIIGTLGIGTARPHEYTPEEKRRLEEVAALITASIGMNQKK